MSEYEAYWGIIRLAKLVEFRFWMRNNLVYRKQKDKVPFMIENKIRYFNFVAVYPFRSTHNHLRLFEGLWDGSVVMNQSQ